ncbi:uncharacterized protein [Dermacentor andersoni]|uniref:uncharacterized protein isoform X1 n=1 Tax=Dermacentor andersoni TaxID=34620 RepID=UPI002417F954|nr:uncharacterized protein LOC126535870 isoform X1 [Dermacentor andersoni]
MAMAIRVRACATVVNEDHHMYASIGTREFCRHQGAPGSDAGGKEQSRHRISNALLLLILFFIVVNPEEATVYIKLSIVHTTLKEVSLLPIPYVITTTLSIMVDLLLLIGIEDNCREVLQVYIGWSSACTAFESVSWIGLVAWKANSENLGFFKTPSIILIGVVLFKVYTVRHLRDYLRVLKDAQPITRAPS